MHVCCVNSNIPRTPNTLCCAPSVHSGLLFSGCSRLAPKQLLHMHASVPKILHSPNENSCSRRSQQLLVRAHGQHAPMQILAVVLLNGCCRRLRAAQHMGGKTLICVKKRSTTQGVITPSISKGGTLICSHVIHAGQSSSDEGGSQNWSLQTVTTWGNAKLWASLCHNNSMQP